MQSPDHVGRAGSLTLAQLDDGADVAEKGLQEQLQVQACLLVDVGRDALDTATASQAADGGLGDALDVVAEDFSGSGVMLVKLLKYVYTNVVLGNTPVPLKSGFA